MGAAAARHTPVHIAYSPPGSSVKPDVAGRACILSGNRVAKVRTTSRGRVAMGLCWKSKKQKASRSIAVVSSTRDCCGYIAAGGVSLALTRTRTRTHAPYLNLYLCLHPYPSLYPYP